MLGFLLLLLVLLGEMVGVVRMNLKCRIYFLAIEIMVLVWVVFYLETIELKRPE